MKPKLTTKKPEQRKRNHSWVGFVMVSFILVLFFFLTGCGALHDDDSSSESTHSGVLQVNQSETIRLPVAENTYSQYFNVTPTETGVEVTSSTVGNVTTTQFNLTALGISADREISIEFTKQ